MEISGLGCDVKRRQMLQYAMVTGVSLSAESYAFAASDFWNKQKAAEWTDQEKEELRTKSPWARKVDAEMGGGRGGGGGEDGGDEGGGGGGRGGGGGGRGRGSGGGGGGAGFGGGQTQSLGIIWISAKPIQDAHPLDLG